MLARRENIDRVTFVLQTAVFFTFNVGYLYVIDRLIFVFHNQGKQLEISLG